MKTRVEITDKDSLRALTPAEAETYLLKTGWTLHQRVERKDGKLIGNDWTIGEKPPGLWSETIAHVPGSQRYVDYFYRVQQMLEDVARYEGHDDQLRVYNAMKGIKDERLEIELATLLEEDIVAGLRFISSAMERADYYLTGEPLRQWADDIEADLSDENENTEEEQS